ncbi:MAG: site-specific integrase [Chitinophagaceae bacterium]|nr:site-specific integrase [Chitinophagaceae bacterium]MCA6460581.1 site-specific integrase [Chitinophagaceae bacterium]MCA6464073.1 site-specific integrase [Chitinophagaceae bacterium]
MLRTNFYLRTANTPKETTIYLRLFCKSKGIKYRTGIKVPPAYWDKKKQRIKPVSKFENHLEINRYLDIVKKVADKSFWDLTNNAEGIPPTLSTLKDEIDKRLDRVDKEPVLTFFEFFQKIIDQSEAGTRLNPLTGKVINPNTIKTYVTTLNHLKDFQKKQHSKITFENIDLKFYNSFTEYLIKEKKLASNSVGKDIQVLKLILNEALDLHLTSNTSFKTKRFVVLREESDSIYLDKKELEELKDHDLSDSPRLERVRDLFLVGCYTGLRYSDYSILTADNIKNGYIQISQTKTGTQVTIPVHKAIVGLLEKYSGKFPASLSNQKTNDYLKELGKEIKGLQKSVNKTITKEGASKQVSYAKWEMLTTHTARRSFATNEFLAGTSTLTIMAITGHKTEKAFLKYIRLNSADHAKLLKEQWDKR